MKTKNKLRYMCWFIASMLICSNALGAHDMYYDRLSIMSINSMANQEGDYYIYTEIEDMHSNHEIESIAFAKIDIEEYLSGLVGKYSIQFVSFMQDRIEIGVSDISSENIEMIREEIKTAGIDIDIISFILTSSVDSDDWGETYEKYQMLGDIEDMLFELGKCIYITLFSIALYNTIIH